MFHFQGKAIMAVITSCNKIKGGIQKVRMPRSGRGVWEFWALLLIFLLFMALNVFSQKLFLKMRTFMDGSLLTGFFQRLSKKGPIKIEPRLVLFRFSHTFYNIST